MSRQITPEARERAGNHKAIPLLENYASNSDLRRARTPDLVKFDDLPAEWKALLASKDPATTTFFHRLVELKTRFTFITRLVELKLRFIYDASMDAINSGADLPLALAARSVYEHVASLAYIHAKNTAFLQDLKAAPSFEAATVKADTLIQIYKAQVLGSRFFTTDEDLAKLGLCKATNVLTMIDTADKTIKQFRRMYDLLCEVVHPNYLSNAIVTNANLQDWSLEADQEYQADIRSWVLDAIAAAIEATEHLTEHWFWRFIYETDHLYRKLLFNRTTLADLHVEAKFGFSGDGKARESAIQFHANSWRDHYRMLEVYASQNLAPGKQLAEPEQFEDPSFHYDKHKLPNGELWTKIPKAFDFPQSNNNRWIYGKTSFNFSFLGPIPTGQELLIVRAELTPRLVPEFILFLRGNEPAISQLAATRPFGFYSESAGFWKSQHGPVMFVNFKVSASGPDGAPVKKLTLTSNPLAPSELAALRALAKQTHLHLALINERHEEVDFFEFANTIPWGQLASDAESACKGMQSQDFEKARAEFYAKLAGGDLAR